MSSKITQNQHVLSYDRSTTQQKEKKETPKIRIVDAHPHPHLSQVLQLKHPHKTNKSSNKQPKQKYPHKFHELFGFTRLLPPVQHESGMRPKKLVKVNELVKILLFNINQDEGSKKKKRQRIPHHECTYTQPHKFTHTHLYLLSI